MICDGYDMYVTYLNVHSSHHPHHEKREKGGKQEWEAGVCEKLGDSSYHPSSIERMEEKNKGGTIPAIMKNAQ